MKRNTLVLTIVPLLALVLYPAAAFGYTISADSIYKHISVLASDSLEGRETGEPGEFKAAAYIVSVFESADLQPKGDTGSWLQEFEFTDKIEVGERNRLAINEVELILHEEFEPLLQSASTTFQFDDFIFVDYGITLEDSSYDDYAGRDVEGKAVIVKRHAPESEDSSAVDFSACSSLTDKIARALDHKATGVFFYTPEDHDDTMIAIAGGHVTPKDIPVIWLRRKGLEKLGLDLAHPGLVNASGQTELIAVRDTGYNVVACLPSDNDTAVVITAHYDHLGWGGPTSRYLEEPRKIHYGADDNGSGVAALLELARRYSAERSRLKYTYLFVALTGEEKGLLGSGHFVRNMPVDSSTVRMTINMDMIGRLKDQEKGLAIFGTGTCTEFKTFFDSLQVDDIKLALKESGTGPSDHTAFYNMGIPVLYFFTGAHEDYHTPDDVVDKIDLEGIVRVAGLVDRIVTHFDGYDGLLAFQRTKHEDTGRRRGAYSVTLGIMPDFISELRGLGVDGVSADGPGERAGLIKGDVIIKMGALVIDDIYTYMNALGKFRKGDTTTLLVERDNDTLALPVEFK
ncbi:MAG TPA: M20/M25/M40 family metallo-hydrolase [Acidobacteriota bacterium]|nr:M20/M25/M40 family metallo-hydrolase [Acidobacteriota bacterium]